MSLSMSITVAGKTVYIGPPRVSCTVIQNQDEFREYIMTPDSDYPRLSLKKTKEVKKGVK